MIDQKVFFLTTIPGLESVTHLELCEKWGRAADFFEIPPFPEVRFFRGGVEFDAPVALGFLLNHLMKTPTRILMREAAFPAANEREFVQGLKALPWEDYFQKKSSFDFKMTSKSSKISMKHQVQKCLQEILKKHAVSYKEGAPSVFVRIFRDQCNISFDLTGEAAFKRGTGARGSVASLRESTAHALLRVLLQGIQGPFDLIDPMCGSGTFLNEVLSMGKPMERKFCFESFPIYQKYQGEIEKSLNDSTGETPAIIKAYGFDNNDKAIQLAQKNLKIFDPEKWSVVKEDLFSTDKVYKNSGTKKVVVLNPPWGKRLPGVSQDILKAVYDKYKPDRIGLLMPARWKINSIPLEKTRDLAILNSGVENRFLVFA